MRGFPVPRAKRNVCTGGDDGRTQSVDGRREARAGPVYASHWDSCVHVDDHARPGFVPPYQGTLGALSDLISPADGVRWERGAAHPPATHLSCITGLHALRRAGPVGRLRSSAVHAHGERRFPLWKGSCFARFGDVKGRSVRVFRAPGVLASPAHPSCFLCDQPVRRHARGRSDERLETGIFLQWVRMRCAAATSSPARRDRAGRDRWSLEEG